MTRTAIVTGSTGGIGRALCQSFYDDGVTVIGISHSEENGAPWKNHVCDLSDLNSLDAVIATITQENKNTPDILINNAGLYHAKPWQEMSAKDFNDAMSVNTAAPFLLMQSWAKGIISENKSGVCVNVSSVSAHLGSVDVSYAASKAGLNLVTKTMAKALAEHDIRINGVAPGPVKTKMADRIPKDRQEKYKENIPMNRFAEASEIVSVVKFLVSDESSFMTGETINVDGGLS